MANGVSFETTGIHMEPSFREDSSSFLNDDLSDGPCDYTGDLTFTQAHLDALQEELSFDPDYEDEDLDTDDVLFGQHERRFHHHFHEYLRGPEISPGICLRHFYSLLKDYWGDEYCTNDLTRYALSVLDEIVHVLGSRDHLVGVELNPGPPKVHKEVIITTTKTKKRKNKKKTKSNRSSVVHGGLNFARIGGQIGTTAGRFISKLTGMGDYRVNSNSLIAGNIQNPSFGNASLGSVITHREFLTDITGSTSFTTEGFYINPGNPFTFPWLSNVAQHYEEYELLGLVFEYKATSGVSVGSTNTALGTVVMTTNYNAADPVFTTKQQMEAYLFTTSGSPFDHQIHPVECARGANVLNHLYTRGTVATPDGTDLRLYDLGLFQIATVGMQAANVIGELWVSYNVRLYKPRLPSSLSEGVNFMHIVSSPANNAATAAARLGTTGGVLRSSSTLTSTMTTNSFTLNQAGFYCVSASWVGATITATAVFSLGSNMGFKTLLNDDTNTQSASFIATAANTLAIIQVAAEGDGAANTVTISGLTTMTAADADIFVTLVPEHVNLQSTKSLLQRISELETTVRRRDGSLILVNSDSDSKECWIK
jgi:hypothetical protein